jgi:hypothetical protein
VNPADSPILILALTSKTLTRRQLYDAASNVLQQRLSQMHGIGEVIVGSSALPAVRVELSPVALFKYGSGLEDVRAARASANANSPKGAIEQGGRRYQLYTNDKADQRPTTDHSLSLIAMAPRCGSPTSPTCRIQSRICAARVWPMANPQCWCRETTFCRIQSPPRLCGSHFLGLSSALATRMSRRRSNSADGEGNSSGARPP